MTTKRSSELSFQDSREPIPTIEIDIGSISEMDRIQTIRSVLSRCAQTEPDALATVYVYTTVSFNFHEMTNSDFIGVVGSPKILQAMHTGFARFSDARVRFSDYINTREAVAAWHIEDGQLWMPEDAVSWYASESTWSGEAWSDADAGADVEGDAVEDDTAEDDTAEDGDPSEQKARTRVPARFRAARADASVGSIRRQIESVFGLPEGSVALCGPDGKPLRADARIGTLRRRWEW